MSIRFRLTLSTVLVMAVTIAIISVLIALLCACSPTSAQQARSPGPTDAVATVNGKSILLATIDEKALEQSSGDFGGVKLAQAIYEARRAAGADYGVPS